MEWTEQDTEFLQSFRDKIDYDGIKVKQQIKSLLLNNKYIVHVLNNEELESDEATEPVDYYGVNIFPAYIIHPTQHNVQNFLCFTVSFDEMYRYNPSVKFLEITFTILCHIKNLTDEDTTLPRHDLLGALLQDQFNYTNICGRKIQIIEDKEIVVDNDYVGRSMTFRQITDNNMVKTKGGTPRLINKETHV